MNSTVYIGKNGFIPEEIRARGTFRLDSLDATDAEFDALGLLDAAVL